MILGQSYDMAYDNLTRNLKIFCKLGPWMIGMNFQHQSLLGRSETSRFWVCGSGKGSQVGVGKIFA